jgi:hypothetical protein
MKKNLFCKDCLKYPPYQEIVATNSLTYWKYSLLNNQGCNPGCDSCLLTKSAPKSTHLLIISEFDKYPATLLLP